MTNYIKNIISNIKYLMKYSLKEKERDVVFNSLDRVEDIYRYEIMDGSTQWTFGINVLNYEQTIELLLKEPKSFCRFGDGEIDLIKGKSIPFQEYDSRLANIMLNILQENLKECYVGINYNYFHSTKGLSEYNRKFYLVDVKPYRDFLVENCNRNNTYIAAAFNQIYMVLNEFDYDDYYHKIKMMFKDRELVIFSGEGILDSLQYDVFEKAKSKEFVYGLSKNAFRQYDELLDKAKRFSKEKTLCFILGPTSKALVYELSKLGYTAWDIGHMAKDYDMYKKKQEKTDANIRKFYQPD